MKNRLSGFFGMAVLAAFIFLPTVPAMAWDDVGHKITAYIAWTRMTPQTRENVIKILRDAPEDSQLGAFYLNGPEPEAVRERVYFELAATWPDIVRDRDFETRYKKYHKGSWHYADTFWKQSGGRVEALSGFEDSGQAVTRLSEFDKTVRDPSVAAAEKAVAIAWMMHLTGDIHQPLHTSARVTDTEPKGDQGGNLFSLTPRGTPREKQQNLHGFWDSIVGRADPLKGTTCAREYIESVGDRMMKRYPFAKDRDRLNLGLYDRWQGESFAFNNTDVFSADLKRFELPSSRYTRNAFRVAEREIALAGYRLGETFNSAFGSAAPNATNETRR